MIMNVLNEIGSENIKLYNGNIVRYTKYHSLKINFIVMNIFYICIN